MKRNIIYKKKIFEDENEVLNENPNAIWDDQDEEIVQWGNDNCIVFSRYGDDDKLYYSNTNTHGNLLSSALKDDEHLPNYSYGRGKDSGRLFLAQKIITFWIFPENKSSFIKLLNDLSIQIGINFTDEWRVEIPNLFMNFNDGINTPDGWGTWAPNNETQEYIPIKDYKGGYKRTEYEINQEHELSPLLKKQKHVPDGVGSKKINRKPLELRQAMYAESKKSNNFYPLIEDFLNEFERGISKNTLGIGKRVFIERWLEEMGIENYRLNKDLTIDVEGDVNLSKIGLDMFPKYIKFNRVGGSFDCSNNNKLTTLEGCPTEVGGSFFCYNSNLTTLVGSPVEVHVSFDCSHNNLTTLEGAPNKVGGSFFCGYNKLITLEGGPVEVRKSFECLHNKLTTLEGAPKKLGWGIDCKHNKLVTLEGAPKVVGGWMDCSHNKLTTLEGAPKTTGGVFICSKNKVKFTKEDVKAVCNVNGSIFI